MEKIISKNIKSDLDKIVPRKERAKHVLSQLSSDVVTQLESDRILSNKNESFLSKFISTLFMNKKVYYGLAAFVVVVLAVLALTNGDSLQQFARNGFGPKTKYAVAEQEVEQIATEIEEISNEINEVEKELEELEASLSFDDIDEIMKELDEIPEY